MKTPFIVVIILSFSDLLPKAAPATPTKAHTANDAFFEGPFDPCKGTRILNPVEAVRAHVLATKVFNALGTRTIVRLATKYKVPSSYLYPLGTIACLYNSLIYAQLSNRTDLMLPAGFPYSKYAGACKLFIDMLRKSSGHLTLKYDGKKLAFSLDAVQEFAAATLAALLKAGDGHPPRDVNYLHHGVAYFRRVLL